MGSFFQNIHIRKTPEFSLDGLRIFLTEQLSKSGYTAADPQDCDLIVTVLAPENSQWVSVSSDLFVFDSAQAVRDTLLPYSRAFATDVLGTMCADSDLFFMNLINADDGTDGWFNAGRGPKLRRTALAPFRGKVTNYEAFRAALRSEQIFAEEPFQNAAPYLGMDMEQTLFNCDADGTFPEEIRLGFRLPPGQETPPPAFTWSGSHTSEGNHFVSFLNRGGKSRGLIVVFSGLPQRGPAYDWVEKDEITIEDAYLTVGHSRERIPISLEKRVSTTGVPILFWAGPTIPIPAGVDQTLPPRRLMDLEFERKIYICYRASGNLRKVLEVCVTVFPLKNNPAGGCSWWAYHGYDTPKEYIQDHNKQWKRFPNAQIDPDNYDL